MQPFHPRLADLPTEIAVFPLTGALLLPRGRLPLNIFEPRYLAMTMDALGQGRLFGMVQPDARGKSGSQGPGLYRIGCLGRLSSFSETDDGRLLITLIGVTRFRIAEELPLAQGGYRRVRADYTDFVTDLLEADPPPLDRPACRHHDGGGARSARAARKGFAGRLRCEQVRRVLSRVGTPCNNPPCASLSFTPR
jgi:Lon protease-like protein